MHRTHKIRIYPNATQTKALYRLSGCIRYAYNWMLDKTIKDYEQGFSLLVNYIVDMVTKSII